MRVLRRGSSGDDVQAWQLFLRGQEAYTAEIDGQFGPATFEATRLWQRLHGLVDDGVVGLKTYGKAQELGFNPGFEDDDLSDTGPAWPPVPTFPPLDAEGRKQLFGEFSYRAAPTPQNPEAIEITGTWVADNIESVEIPQLVGLGPRGGVVRLHRLAAGPLRRFFAAVEAAGLRDRLLSFAGTFAPRFVRGSTTTLSNHAYGTAIDLNAAWNPLGVVPALKGKQGSVRELVPIANELGIYWGGHFKGRPDGMHFELARLL